MALHHLLSYNNLLTDPTRVQKYWTSAMFNLPSKLWVWVDEDTTRPNGMVHTNWADNEPPNYRLTRTYSKLCMFINSKPDSSYWESADCSDRAFFICETSKICS